MDRSELLSKIIRAKEEITTAEGELDEVIRCMEASPDEEKVTISQVGRDAFAKLGLAKASLLELEATLANIDR